MTAITPALLVFDDGSPVTAETWPRRRAELRAAIVDHEYGGMPPAARETGALQLSATVLRLADGIGFHTYEVRCVFDDGRELSFDLQLWIPKGAGPFPVVLDGDGCWRYFNDEIIHRVLDRGAIAASFNRTDLAADNKDRYRETGLYRLFPEATFGALSAWAWGYHRCVDVLNSLEFGRGFAEYRHRDRELPYDQHFLHALVAPRGLLIHEAHGDRSANPPGSYAACRAAGEVFGMLGKPDAIGWTVREGKHGHLPGDFDSLLDFLDPRFFGRETVRGFQRQVYRDLDSELR